MDRITQAGVVLVVKNDAPSRVTQGGIVLLARRPVPSRITQAGVVLLVKHIQPPAPVDIAPLEFTLVPEVPVIQTWEWFSVKTTAITGAEQRAILREIPRDRFLMKFIIQNDKDRETYYHFLMQYLKEQFLFPVHVYSTYVTAGAAEGATRVYFNPLSTDIRAGEDIAFYDEHLERIFYAKVTTMNSDGANVEALPEEVKSYYQIMPVFRFRFPEGAKIDMDSIGGSLTMALENVSVRSLKRPGIANQVTVINDLGDSLPLLNQRPLAPADEAFDQNITWVDNSVSLPKQMTQWDYAKISGSRTFFAERMSGLDYWREFFDRVKGQQKGFLFSTFRNDLTLVDIPALSDVAIVVKNLNYNDKVRFPTYRRLSIITANGEIYRRVISTEYIYDDGQPVALRLYLNAPIGNTAGDNLIERISFLNINRMSSDSIQLEHRSFDTYVTFGISVI